MESVLPLYLISGNMDIKRGIVEGERRETKSRAPETISLEWLKMGFRLLLLSHLVAGINASLTLYF